jgi:hypothetical protein
MAMHHQAKKERSNSDMKIFFQILPGLIESHVRRILSSRISKLKHETAVTKVPPNIMQLFRNEELKRELNDIDSLTPERLDGLLDTFLKDFEAGAVESNGWPMYFSAYKVAKAAMNAYSRILARRHPELCINHTLGAVDTGGRWQQGGHGGAAAGRWANRRVL